MIVGITVLVCSCAVPNRDAILKALAKSDMKAAVKAARDDSRSGKFLAKEIVIRSADHDGLTESLYRLLEGSGPEMMPVFESLRHHGSKEIRAMCLMKLHLFGRKGALQELEPYLDAGPGLAKAAAVGAFLEEEQSRGFYEKFIADPEVEVRRRVVSHLAASDEPWAPELLYDAARNDPDPSVRSTAVRVLDPDNERHLELLKEITQGHDPNLVLAALACLARDPEKATLPWLETFLTLPVTSEGIHFAALLLKSGGSSALLGEYLKEALGSPNPTTRQKALGALRLAGADPGGTDALADDKNDEVQLAWCLYQKKMKRSEKKRLDILRRLAKGAKGIVLRAMIALAEEQESGYDEVRARVWHVLRKGDGKSKIYLLNFLGRSFKDMPLALEAMADDEPEVRMLAASAYLKHF
jgi:hypothetical protein